MGNTSSTIKIIFDGSARGIVAAAAETKAALKSIDDENGRVSKGADKVFSATGKATRGILALGSAAGSLQTVAGVAGSLATMSGILAAVPAVAVAGAASMITFKLATAGVGDAFKAAMGPDQAKFDKAIKDLSPNAREAAVALRSMQPEFKALQQATQDQFFYQWADTSKQLGATYLPILNRQLPAIALQMGQMAPLAAKALMEPAVVESLNDSLSGTADMFDGLKTAPGDVLSGIVLLAGAGSGELGGLGNSAGDAAAKFKQWAAEAVETGRAHEWIENAKAELRDYGTILTNVGSIGKTVWQGLSAGGLDFSASLVETTTRLDEFLKTAEGQEALKQLGETLKVTGDVAREILLTAIQELAPVIVELAPAAREVATAIGDNLVAAMHVAGPILQGVAGFLSDNKGLLADLVPILLTAAAGYKGLQIASNVAGWLGAASAAIGAAGKAAGDADPKVGGLAGKLGGLKAIGAGLLITIAIVGIEEGIKALDEMSAKIRTIPKAERSVWDEFILGADDAANSVTHIEDKFKNTNWSDFWDPNGQLSSAWQGFMNSVDGWNPKPIELGLNDQPARTALNGFMAEVNGHSPTVNIDGRTEGAAQALADVVQAINQGRGTVNINGTEVPAQEALDRIVQIINNSVGLVNVDGNMVPAGDALAGWIRSAQETPGPKVPVGADTTRLPQEMNDGIGAALLGVGTPAIPVTADTIQAGTAIGVVRDSIRQPDTKPMLGDPADILGKIADVDARAQDPKTKPLLGDPTNAATAIGAIDQSQTTPQTKPLLGNNANGLGAVGALDQAQTTPQTKPLQGNNAQGMGQVQALDAAGRAPVTKDINSRDANSGSVWNSIFQTFAKPITQVIRVVQEIFSAGGGAVGPFPGLATGGTPSFKGHVTGAIYGPGTGTSDTAGLYRLSNGEHVLTAAEVAALGGQDAVYRLRAMIRAGMLPGFASGGSPGVVGGDGAAAPGVNVSVFIDGQEFRGMIDTRIAAADRATARTARVGAGVGWGS